MHDNKLLLTYYQGKLLALLMGNNRLLSVKVYEEEKASLVGNIYVGKIQSMAKGIAAAFVEIADKQICFLPMEDCKNPFLLHRKYDGKLKQGDELLVQVTRDAIKTKQPVATTQISLAGKYLAMSLGNDKLGISSKIPSYKKQEITAFLQKQGLVDENKKCVPQAVEWVKEETSPVDSNTLNPVLGTVIRTNTQELTDFSPLLQEWKTLGDELKNIFKTAPYRTAFSTLKKSNSPYLEDLKSYYVKEFDEILTDDEDIYKELQAYMAEQKQALDIENVPVRFYEDEYPLEKLYSIKTRIEEALGSRVWLKSGGYLVIEPTEALTVIDVNTGKYEASKGKDSEETFFSINMEAAQEIALQLKLRNLSGIIIVDFINLEAEEKKKKLLEYLKQLLTKDAVRTTVIDMTPLGLVEITRKRVNRPLRELLSPTK